MDTEIQFGEWMPDAPTYKNPGCVIADNVIPTTMGYGPFLGLVGQSDTVSDDVQGAEQFYDNSETSLIVGGTDDSLFVRRASVTETSGMTSIGAGEAWDFARFNDFVIATSVNNSPQYLSDIDTDNTWSALPGSPPQAKRCAKVGEFLMLGNVSGVPNRIQWSSYNNPTGSWASDRLTQANFADLDAELGSVQRIVGGRYGMVFQERGIQRISNVGAPKVWNADVISSSRGTTAPFSVVTVGYLSYFLAQDGFYITNGSAIESVGTNRVNEWFFDNVEQSTIVETHGAVDWQNECIIWAFKSDAAGDFNRFIIYSWAQNRWSTGTVDVGWLVGTAKDAVSIDALDAIYGNLDAIPLSLDAVEFKSGLSRLGAFVNSSTTSEFNTFTGSPLQAEWETGEAQPVPGKRVFVDEVYPKIETENMNELIQLKMRGNRGQRTVSAQKEVGWSGFAPVRGEGQQVAVNMVKPAGTDWSDAQGVQVSYSVAGSK
ncbi:hypothetical protein [uncultured Ruegeria sp.]|uniref:hypothetical protein n=1 Tax=uncultured Ruegeria sp. TaxID=259304 RepID=UPI00262B9961|nr:hypothetical protein [uncultured Ruegeria sp.]